MTLHKIVISATVLDLKDKWYHGGISPDRAAAVARLPRSLLDPELFPHTAYVKILATLARKTAN